MIPIELKPFPDEAISSWIIRNAIANGSDPSSWSAGIWPEWRIWTRDIDRSFPVERANKLSKITSLTADEIKHMTLEPFICRIEDVEELNVNAKWKWVIPTGERGSIKVNGMHFCPECLSDPVPYLKKQWRLSWNTVCSKHRCYLLLHCPECNEAFSPYKVTYENTDFTFCTHCGFDLKRARISVANVEISNVQEQINRFIFEESHDDFPLELKAKTIADFFTSFRLIVLFFRRLHHFESHHKIILHELGLSLGDCVCNYHKGDYFDALSVEERASVLLQAMNFLQLPVVRMIDVLKSSQISQQMFIGEVEFRTDFINEIMYRLDDKSRDYPKRTTIQEEIKPKSKEEVLEVMEELRGFIS